MNSIKPLNEFTSLDLEKEIKKSFKHYNTKDLSTNTYHIIELLSQLGKKNTINFFKSIDELFPGLSFHYIMEARHANQNKACTLLILRVSYFIKAFPEKQVFAPMRKRLIHGLLFDNDSYDTLFNELKSGLTYIDNITSLSVDEKKKLKKSLNKVFFKKYKESSYFDILLNDVDNNNDEEDNIIN